jgi:hypothetical protein
LCRKDAAEALKSTEEEKLPGMPVGRGSVEGD